MSFSNFDTPPTNGRSPILSLNLWWDQGVNNWVSVAGDYPNYTLSLKHKVSLLIAGSSYRFKYRGINAFGKGPFSAEETVIAASKPD